MTSVSQKCSGTMKDFVVETEGQCFLCMAHIPTSSSSVTLSASLPIPSSASSNIHSVQYLSRYLQMDRLKVFNEKGDIPLQLVSQVERAKLKVMLCEDCGILNQQFSVLFQQLEKTKMKIARCLNLIQRKLAASNTRNVTYGNPTLIDLMLTESPSRKGLMGKEEVADVLRNEAMQKCSLKLTTLAPRVKVNNLTLRKVEETRLKMKVNCRRAPGNYIPENSTYSEPGTSAIPNFKIEPDDDILFNVDVNDTDEFPIYTDDEGSSHLPKLDDSKSVINYPISACGLKLEVLNVKVEGSSRRRRRKVRGRREIGTLNKEPSPSNPSTKLTSPAKKYKMKYSINPVSGKISCGICLKNYSSTRNFETHYESIHLKSKYKCHGCSKVFLHKNSWYNHRQAAHTGMQFVCDVCNKSFTQRNNLQRHYHTIHQPVVDEGSS